MKFKSYHIVPNLIIISLPVLLNKSICLLAYEERFAQVLLCLFYE